MSLNSVIRQYSEGHNSWAAAPYLPPRPEVSCMTMLFTILGRERDCKKSKSKMEKSTTENSSQLLANR